MNEIPRDLGALLIEYKIGGMIFDGSLLDSRDSVIPNALYDQFKFKNLEPFMPNLLLANGYIREPWGMLEDLIIKFENQ